MINFVSVIVPVPVYNCEKFIIRTLESILNQTYKNFELLIINDVSTNGSAKILENYALKELVLS